MFVCVAHAFNRWYVWVSVSKVSCQVELCNVAIIPNRYIMNINAPALIQILNYTWCIKTSATTLFHHLRLKETGELWNQKKNECRLEGKGELFISVTVNVLSDDRLMKENPLRFFYRFLCSFNCKNPYQIQT